jgi:predicted transposase YbfD/YdcC
MRARGLDGGHRLAAKLHVSRPTRDRASGPSQGGLGARVGFPHAAQVVQVTRKTRELGTRRWRVVVVYAVTSLAHAQASPARPADLLRRHWAIENGLHWVRDVTFAEDHSQLRTGSGPQVMACLRNLAIGASAAPGRSTSPLPSASTPATHADPSGPSGSPSDETDITPERRSREVRTW